MKKFLILGLIAVISACTLAPDYTRPDIDTALQEGFKEDGFDSWKESTPYVRPDTDDLLRIFADENLSNLIAQAHAQSPALAMMVARINQARASADIAGSYFIPTLEGDLSARREQPNATIRQAATAPKIENNYKAGLGISYELDLFGRVLGGKRTADFTLQAAESDYQAAVLALNADIAQLYFMLSGQDAEIALLEKTLKLREDSLRILQKRLEFGAITELDVVQYVVELETTRSDLYGLKSDRARNEHALAVLTGLTPAAFNAQINGLPENLPTVPAGLSSDLLEARPDIIAAEKDLMASNERIGIARAAFFPNIMLTGAGGFESGLIGSLFNWSSRSWALGPLATIPIFAGGRAVYNKDRAWAAYEESVASYRQKVLVAFREVEDSLVTLHYLNDQSASQTTAEQAANKATNLAKMRYDTGDTGYLESITAERSALDVARFGIQIRVAQFTETVRLLRALGRSW